VKRGQQAQLGRQGLLAQKGRKGQKAKMAQLGQPVKWGLPDLRGQNISVRKLARAVTKRHMMFSQNQAMRGT
jgi:hypothetical protein